MITNQYNYSKFSRVDSRDGRFYCTPDGHRVKSVTTILDATKPEEQKAALAAWRKRMGPTAADAISKEASSRGTRLHKYLEDFITTDQLREPGSNPFSVQSHRMAHTVIENYLKPNVTEYYGSEVNLFYPELYAGTTDSVALWQGQLAILDFKQTNKPKRRDMVEGYCLQLAAYAMAHNLVYQTNINTGVILMCSQDYQPQHWVIQGDEFDHYCAQWALRVAQFYNLS
jgi:genome maintenance exonuclease 1